MSTILRQPLLTPEKEAKLKEQLTEMWLNGVSAKRIASDLQFGVENTEYEKLKPQYVFYYRYKFGLPLRRVSPIKRGGSRYKTNPRNLPLLNFKKFKELLDSKIPLTKHTSFKIRRQRAFLILLFWSPLRKSEIIERKISDFEINKTSLIIHLLRKKKRFRANVQDEPLKIPLALPLMGEFVAHLNDPRWNSESKPFNFCSITAWQYVCDIFPNYFPHFFRFEYITKGLEDPLTSVIELSAKTRLSYGTLERYIAVSDRHQDSFDERLLKRVREELNDERS